jgi:hypothetical protein
VVFWGKTQVHNLADLAQSEQYHTIWSVLLQNGIRAEVQPEMGKHTKAYEGRQ